jgi:hypothetical protein
MYSSQLNRQALGSCRSYGAWLSIWLGRYYKHGAPNGLGAFTRRRYEYCVASPGAAVFDFPARMNLHTPPDFPTLLRPGTGALRRRRATFGLTT